MVDALRLSTLPINRFSLAGIELRIAEVELPLAATAPEGYILVILDAPPSS